MIGNGNVVQRFHKNVVGRDYVVGDIHGCLQDLIDMLDAIKFNRTTDRLFSVGDLIDRGPNSYDAAMLIYQPCFHFVRANHEQMMIDAVLDEGDSDKAYYWASNGGSWHHDVDDQLLEDLVTDLNKSPYVIVVGEGTERINIVHAEVVAATDADIDEWERTNTLHPSWQKNELIWGRSHIYNPAARAPGLSLTIVGHTPQIEPIYHKHVNHLYIDTGCVFRYRETHTPQDRKLTMADITDKDNIRLISYSGLNKYVEEIPLSAVKRV